MKRMGRLIIGVVILTAILQEFPQIIYSLSDIISGTLSHVADEIQDSIRNGFNSVINDVSNNMHNALFRVQEELVEEMETAAVVSNEFETTKERIKEIQHILNNLGYNVGEEDGIWGLRTLQAMNSFQNNNSLDITSTLDELTYQVICGMPIYESWNDNGSKKHIHMYSDEICTVCKKAKSDCQANCQHNMTYIYSEEHPHQYVYCGECGFEIKEMYAKNGSGRTLSTCDICFSNGDYDLNRALEMAQMAKSVYNIYDSAYKNAVEISDDYSYEIKTECRVAVSASSDGELIVTISFQGSTFSTMKDIWDDWITKDFSTSTNSEGVRAGIASGIDRFMENYIYSNNPLTIDCDIVGWSGKHTIKELLDYIKCHENAHLRITGHSLGGSYAQCFAYYMISKHEIPAEQIETYTFAALPPFSDSFVESHGELSDANIYNFIHVQDTAPDVGPASGIPEFLTSVLTSKWFTDGGNTVYGSNIGKNIYMHSDMKDLVINLGNTHAMDTYIDLIAHYSDADHSAYEDIPIRDVIRQRKIAESEFKGLLNSINDSKYNVVIKRGSIWLGVWAGTKEYALLEQYSMLDVYVHWNELAEKLDADDFVLCESSYVSMTMPAGDSPIIPFREAVMLTREEYLSVIIDIYNEYHKYDYMWEAKYAQ